MIRRKKHLDFFYIKFIRFENLIKKSILLRSLKKNYRLNYINRISFNLQKNYKTKDFRFYKSQNKLQCPFNYSFSVPSKRIKYSRFFINKTADRLFYGGFQKK